MFLDLTSCVKARVVVFDPRVVWVSLVFLVIEAVRLVSTKAMVAPGMTV